LARVMVTGGDGFTGRYLTQELYKRGHDAACLVRSRPSEPIFGAWKTLEANLLDVATLQQIIEELAPHHVAHLAAISFVAHGNVSEIYETNIVGTRNILEAFANLSSLPRSILVASSAAVYDSSIGGKLDETAPLGPANDYGVSKLAMEYLARLYRPLLPIVITRPFNYTGVGQSESFLIPKIVDHVRRRAPIIELGNLEIERDFSDVRNVAVLYASLLECPAAVGGTFNICSGNAYSLSKILEMVRNLSGHVFEVSVNPAFVRANDTKTLSGSSESLATLLGAVQMPPFRDTLQWMLES
jgi:GDP-6-deoxy-D-talose 4-dehydrogenase